MFARNGIIIVFAAFAIGGASGWFAARDDRARSPSAPDGRAWRSATAAAGELNVTEAELAALRDKVASLKKELNEVLV